MAKAFDVSTAREQFPALQGKQVYLDNAGGSQVLSTVAESVRHYLLQSNVQLGASYAIGRQSTKAYTDGYKAAAEYINATPDEIVLGSSTTQLYRNLSFVLQFNEGDEIVLSKLDHEANVASWLGLAERQKLVVKWWEPATTENPRLEASQLDKLLSNRTRLVCCTHVSNILGTIHDVKAIAQKVHTVPGALYVVDGVAYAPHGPIDVKELGVDFYAFSWYKVYGPHISMVYGSKDILPKIGSLGHYFNGHATLAEKLGLAGSTYELVQSIPTLIEYFGPEPIKAWSAIAEHEERLSTILLQFLTSHSKVTVRGEKSPSRTLRVPTISFTVEGRTSQSVIEEADARSDLGFRWGHFYSKRLINDVLGLSDDGVVRVSMVHYNTEDEARKLVKLLADILG